MRIFNAPFIVGMRALLQVSEAFRHEASFKTVFPPIGAVAPVTSVPVVCYAGFRKKLKREDILRFAQNDIGETSCVWGKVGAACRGA